MPHPKKKTVRISFQSPGTKPPVFLAGTFTYPAWQPKEMDHRAKPEVEGKEPSDELEFYGTYDVPEGNHQYKFRLGDGDWWVCDESSETGRLLNSEDCAWLNSLLMVVLDEAGNRNNLLRVASQSLTTQDRAKTSVPEKKHAHARPHISWGATDPNPVWDLIGIDPAEASNDQHLLSPPIHELDCPLREHHDPDHPTYLAKAADAYRCDESSINPTGTRGESKVNGSKSEVDDEAVSQAVKPRPSVIRVSPTNVREHLFIPAPKNTPVFHETLASPPRQQDDERSLSPYGSQGSRTFGSYKANDLDAIQDIRFRNTTLASTPEEEEDLPDTEEMDCLNDESPQRRQLSHADIQSVRRSMTHLAAKSNQRLVNSAESDQTTPYDPDDHSEAPRLPHEALTPMTPQNTFPRSNTMTPKLFPQAHSRIPTISLLNDPILAAFPTGDHGLLSRRAAAANGKEKLGDKLGHEWIGGEDLMSDEEEDEQPLSAMTHSPTFSHEVPLDYQQIRQESLHRRLSSATGKWPDSHATTRIYRKLSYATVQGCVH